MFTSSQIKNHFSASIFLDNYERIDYTCPQPAIKFLATIKKSSNSPARTTA